jgi:diadenosine tetraphosphate (Ap4A) HIT family hydrolase
MDCIFCKIVGGKIPSAKIYDDEICIAILDINPLSLGHSLLITKEHYPTFLETPPGILSEMMNVSYKIITAIKDSVGADGYNLLFNNNKSAGQVIPHLHLHIIPRKVNDGIRFNWEPKSYNGKEMSSVADSIRSRIK